MEADLDSNKNTVLQLASIFPVNPKPEKEIKLRRRRSIIREFSLNTSTHGIPGIARSESIHNRIFWTVAFLAFLGIMLYFIVEAIRAYFAYPTQTSVELKSERSQFFPAFTFCNGGGLRSDILKSLYTASTNVSNITNSVNSAMNLVIFLRILLPELINTGQSLDPFLFSLQSMLISCTYAGMACTAKDFTSFFSASYGRCYTFNAKTKTNTLLYSYSNSGLGVLSLRLYLYDHLYTSYVNEGKLNISEFVRTKLLLLVFRRSYDGYGS